MNLYMLPRTSDLGIGRVVEAYRKHLPAFGVTLVESEEDADIVAVHAGTHADRQPDVHHCHGLYPTATLDTSSQFYSSNADVIENARAARVVTVPSEWVADIFRRDMLLNPVVLPHGVDVDEWQVPAKHANYVLWAKGHLPGVCDPTVVNDLAKMLPHTNFVTTYGSMTSNVNVIGRQSFGSMKQVLSNAAVYLAVTKETFGIQTLEAMALGKPVVGYRWGGTADIVRHGQTGWLVEPGDVKGLTHGISWALEHSKELGENARQVVEDHYSWRAVCRRLADLYRSLVEEEHTGPKVSVVIPCYNYGDCVANAIESVLNQTVPGGMEIIVVDDGSTDNSAEVISEYVSKGIRMIQLENTGSPAYSRNCGIRYATGKYISCLDADDEAMPGSLALFASELDDDRGLGIVYGGLQMVYGEDGKFSRKSDWPPDFCYSMQVLGHNQIPSFCMFRKKAWLRAGGYRAKYTPAEDAEFWTRIATVGFDASKVTDDVTYVYDAHEGSLSRSMKEPDWSGDKPWSRNPDITPFAAPACKYREASFPVRNYDDPWVSVVIPVGPGHGHLVWRAVESVWLQSVPYVECIVVDDSGEDLVQPSTMQPLQEAYPFVKLLSVDDRNVSIARNVGADAASAPFFVFLDADDQLGTDYVAAVMEAFNDNPESYVYTDWISYNGRSSKHQARSFDCERLKAEALHAVTALVPKAWHDAIGGFDAELGIRGWEDWDYFLKLVLLEKHCGYRVPEPLMTYDATTGLRRDSSYMAKDDILPIILRRYGGVMCVRCTSSKSKKSLPVAPTLRPTQVGNGPTPVARVATPVTRPPKGRGLAVASTPRNRVQEDIATVANNEVSVKENSGNIGRHQVIGMATGRKYGLKRHGDVFKMDVRDARVQHHLYIMVDQQKERTQMPQRPVAPVAVREPPAREQPIVAAAPPPPVKTAQPVQSDDGRGEDVQEQEAYSADEEGIDISLLTLNMIKALDLDPETAAIAYEEEYIGKGRTTVLMYLEDLAGDRMGYEIQEEYA